MRRSRSSSPDPRSSRSSSPSSPTVSPRQQQRDRQTQAFQSAKTLLALLNGETPFTQEQMLAVITQAVELNALVGALMATRQSWYPDSETKPGTLGGDDYAVAFERVLSQLSISGYQARNFYEAYIFLNKLSEQSPAWPDLMASLNMLPRARKIKQAHQDDEGNWNLGSLKYSLTGVVAHLGTQQKDLTFEGLQRNLADMKQRLRSTITRATHRKAHSNVERFLANINPRLDDMCPRETRDNFPFMQSQTQANILRALNRAVQSFMTNHPKALRRAANLDTLVYQNPWRANMEKRILAIERQAQTLRSTENPRAIAKADALDNIATELKAVMDANYDTEETILSRVSPPNFTREISKAELSAQLQTLLRECKRTHPELGQHRGWWRRGLLAGKKAPRSERRIDEALQQAEQLAPRPGSGRG